ncbi:MAG: YdjY domain-containing protein [Phycisphaerales bacterium]
MRHEAWPGVRRSARACCFASIVAMVASAACPTVALAWPPLGLWRTRYAPPPTSTPSTPLAPPRSVPERPDLAASQAQTPGLDEVFPHVRLDRDARLVEFDAVVPINAHATDGSVVFLEAIACRPDTKEHESLAMTRAMSSHVHAALLLLGLEPGSPGRWEWEGTAARAVPPTGPALRVTIAWTDADGTNHEHDACDLIVRRDPNATAATTLTLAHTLRADFADAPFVFAGSRFVVREGREWYDADGAGLVIGLHTFGGETIALAHTMHHEAEIEEPEWIARADLLPTRGTPVVVRVRVP